MKNDNKNIYIIGMTIFVIIIWIASDIYHIAVTSTIPTDVRSTITPFDPKLDLKIFEKLRAKKDPDQFSVTTETKLSVVSSSPSANIASPSATQ
jgi:hypothetical protein